MKKLLLIAVGMLWMAASLGATEVKTLQGDFVQVREQAMFQEPQESRGRFYFVADSLLRWEYTYPESFGLLANGSNIRLLRNGERAQASSAYALQSLVKMIMQSISGNFSQGQGIYRVETERTKDETVVTLTAEKRAGRQMFQKMTIWLDQEGVLAREVKMWERSGDCTTILFQNLRLNQPIDKNLF